MMTTMKNIISLSLFTVSISSQAQVMSPCQSLIDAASAGNITKMAMLHRLGVSVDCTNIENTYPLEMAAGNGQEAAVNWLIKHRADVNLHPTAGVTAIYAATTHNYLSIIKILFQAKAKINITQNFNGWTPLMAAALNDNTEIINFLLKNHADLNLKDWTGESALLKAAAHGSLNSVKILTKAGLDPAAYDFYRNTSLTRAAYYCQADVMNYFFSLQGVRFDHEQLESALSSFSWSNCRGEVPAGRSRLLTELEVKTMLEKLVSETGTISPNILRSSLIGVVSSSNGALSIKYLASIGAPVNTQEMGTTLLMNNCRYAHTEEVIALLQAGADPNLLSSDSFESELKFMSPLSFYITQVWDMSKEELSLEAIREFKKVGANINFRDSHGKTALTYAKERKKPWVKAVELLKTFGATE